LVVDFSSVFFEITGTVKIVVLLVFQWCKIFHLENTRRAILGGLDLIELLELD